MMLSTIALAAVTFAAPARTHLDSFVDTIHAADALNVAYTVQEVGGVREEFKVNLAKPNKARIETPREIVVADGSQITTFVKDKNMFFKKAQNPQAFKNMFSDLSLTIWLPFFDEKALSNVAQAKNGADVNRGGSRLKQVNVVADPKAELQMNFFIDSANNVAKQVEFITTSGSRKSTRILNASSVDLKAGAQDFFAFSAPSGAKEVNEADLVANKWHYNLDEAISAAQLTDRVIMVDFMASWCGPCKMMDAEVFQSAAFKEKSRDFVLVKIDVDEQTAVAQKYGVSAMPTVKFLRKDGSVLHEFVGYGGPAQVLGEMAAALSKK